MNNKLDCWGSKKKSDKAEAKIQQLLKQFPDIDLPDFDFDGIFDKTIRAIGNRIYFFCDIDETSVFNLNVAIHSTVMSICSSPMLYDVPFQDMRLYLYIQSGGGALFPALSAMDIIMSSKIPIVTVVSGCCSSSATLLSLVGVKRKITKNAYMLIHQLSSSSWGGKYRDMKDEVSNMDKFMIKIKEVYGKYTKIPESLISEILDHDIWFSAEECLQHGLVDEII